MEAKVKVTVKKWTVEELEADKRYTLVLTTDNGERIDRVFPQWFKPRIERLETPAERKKREDREREDRWSAPDKYLDGDWGGKD